MPQLPKRFIASERFKKLASSIEDKKAVFVAAPSGYGKTTFMIYALSSVPDDTVRICWYHLDESDADLALFYANLIETLFPSEEIEWKSVRTTLQQFSDFPSQYRYVNAIVCQELWSDTKYQRTYLVFDDYQSVAASSEIAETLASFVDNFPPSCAVWVGSRERPAFACGRYGLSGMSVEIAPNDLCFSEDEIADFLKASYRIEIEKNVIEQVYSMTQGWKAAVIMLSQLEPSELQSILKNSLQGTRLFDYVATEVLKNVDSKLMDFLLRICILQDFTADEAGDVLGMENARLHISVCEKRGLFIQKTGRNKGTYSFHTLFREVLTILQKENLTEREILALHNHAAVAYRAKKEYSRAVEHFIRAGNSDAVIELIESESVNFLLLEAYTQLRKWLAMLPDDIVERHPHLLFIKGYVNLRVQTNSSLSLIEKASARYAESDDYDMQIKLLVTFVNLCTSAYERFDKALDYSRQALRILRRVAPSPWREAYRGFFLFLISVCRDKYLRALEISANLQQLALSDELQWELMMISGDVACALGNFSLAESLIGNVLQNPLSTRVDMYRGFALTIYSTALCMQNRDETDLIGNELVSLGVKTDVAYFSGFAARSAAFRHYSAGRVKSALAALYKSVASFAAEETPVPETHARLCSMLWRFNESRDRDKVYLEAHALISHMSSLYPGSCFYEICQSLLGAIIRECGETREAEETLVGAYSSAESKGARHIMCGTLLHLVKLYLDEGIYEKAEVLVTKAMSVASAENYSIFWDMHLPTLNQVLMYCIKAGIYAGYAKKLLAQYFGEEAAVYATNRMPSVKLAQLREFAGKQFLNYASDEAQKNSDMIRVRFFGRFEVSVNGTGIPEERWKTKKVMGLFQYLVYRRGSVISREHLMDLFWPESKKKNAATSLNTALYDMKRIMKEFGLKTDGISGFIKENANGLFINPKADIATDVDAFHKAYNDFKRLKKSRAGRAQLKGALKRISELYSEGFLSGGPIGDWAAEEREEFDRIFIEIAEPLSLLNLEDREYAEAEVLLFKALELDPYNEDLCLGAMNLFVQSGAKTRALKFYQKFEKRLKDELDVEPDDKLRELARCMKNKS